MNKYLFFFILFVSSLFGVNAAIIIDKASAKIMGNKIWQNESGGKVQGLTCWNQGEEFASLGIGHFIWYPEGAKEVFTQTFPGLLIFFKENKVKLPSWLANSNGCPWKSREAFQADINSSKITELRNVLHENIDLQVQFMVRRLDNALPKLVNGLNPSQKKHITDQFYRLAHTSQGIFVLLDYLNFKGEGISEKERYQGKGWGLLQVLDAMPNDSNNPVGEFVESAKKILEQRIVDSPPERNEQKWLQGWFNRLDGYLAFKIL